MAVADVSGVSYFLPIFSFLLVFVISLVVLIAAKITDNRFFQIFLALLIAVIFVSFAGARSFVQNVVPWAAVVIVSAFLILMITGMFGKGLGGVSKGAGIVFVIVLFVIFIIAAYISFSSSLSAFLPWSPNYGTTYASAYFASSRAGGSILLVIVAALVSWALWKVK